MTQVVWRFVQELKIRKMSGMGVVHELLFDIFFENMVHEQELRTRVSLAISGF